MKRFYYFLLALALSLFFKNSEAQTQADIDTVTARLNAATLNTTVTNATVVGFMTKNWDSTVGRWTDINYAIVAPQPGFATDQFFSRIRTLAIAYSKPGTYYHSAAVMNVINKAFSYFYANKTMFNNNAGGWFRDLGYPMSITQAVLLIKNQMDPIVEKNIASYIQNMVVTGWNTGANLAWLNDWKIHEGCIINNATWIKNAVSAIASLMSTTSGSTDGLKVDFAYFQHSMIYNGGYSAWLIPYVISYPTFIKGTAFNTSFPTSILGDYILNGEYWFQFHGFGDIVPQNREFAKPAMVQYVGASNLTIMKSNDPTRSQQYQAYINHQLYNGRYTQPGTKHFFTSDIMVHRDSVAYISVKIPSIRNQIFEIGNYQDLKGYNIGYGLTQILTQGNEYNNIEPVWNWSRLPGTTTPLDTLYLNTPAQTTGAFWSPMGTNSFAGGVSDSTNGIMAFNGTNNGVAATKSYFFLGNAMVCLGAGISSTYTGNTVTSINQTASSGTITVEKLAGKSSPYYGTQTTYSNNLQWIHHNNVGYYFPNTAANIVVKNDIQTGNWYDINHTDTTNLSQKVFSIWIDHGVQPTSRNPATYQYIVVPNITATNFESWTTNNPYTILSNTANIQCVKDSLSNLYGIVFYKAGQITLDNGLTVAVNKAAMLLISGAMKAGNKIKVSVEDPLYVANNIITVTLSNTLTKTIIDTMPKNNYLGATITTSFLADALLPIHISDFKASRNNRSIQLTWESLAVANNKGFGVQRSGDSQNWESIGFLNSIESATSYSFDDNQPLVGNNFYRLNQIDDNGKNCFSEVVKIPFEITNIANSIFSIYPNPTKEIMNIQLGVLNDTKIIVEIFAEDGKSIYSKKYSTSSRSVIPISLTGLTAGNYLVRLTAGNTSQINKVVIK